MTFTFDRMISKLVCCHLLTVSNILSLDIVCQTVIQLLIENQLCVECDVDLWHFDPQNKSGILKAKLDETVLKPLVAVLIFYFQLCLKFNQIFWQKNEIAENLINHLLPCAST